MVQQFVANSHAAWPRRKRAEAVLTYFPSSSVLETELTSLGVRVERPEQEERLREIAGYPFSGWNHRNQRRWSCVKYRP